MALLTPLFLVGLAALAVPVIIHLTQRSRSRVTPFPSLMFLRRIPFKTTRRRRIRDPWLFALRCLALALIALAFARPILPGVGTVDPAAGEARDLVLLLDRSYSMSYGDRWERAREAAVDALADLGPLDRVTLIVFDERAEAVATSTGEWTAVREAIQAAMPGDGATRFDPALRLAGRTLAESTFPRRQVLLVSDFQQSAWPDAEAFALPAGTTVATYDLGETETSNVAVTDLDFRREGGDRIERFTAAARVTNLGSEPIERELSLELAGKTVQTTRLLLDAFATETASFPGVAVPETETRGSVSLSPDRLAADDGMRFMLAADQILQVLVLHGSASRSLFLSRALSIGDAPPMQVVAKGVSAVSPADIEAAGAVILNDVDFPNGAAGSALRRHVEQGGGLLIALGNRSRSEVWSAEAGELMPGRAGAVVDRTADGGGKLGSLDRDHPALELFAAPRSGDFSRARVYRYRELDPHPDATVLARFDDGAAAIVERSFGDGRVLVWVSTLDRFWNDLPLQPLFLPLAQRLVAHAAGYEEADRWYRVGQVIDLYRLLEKRGLIDDTGSTPSEWVVAAPSGERRPVRVGGGPAFVTLAEMGFYEIRPLEGGGASLRIAVNPRLEESDLTPGDAEALAALITPAAETDSESGVAVEGASEGRDVELWWWLAVLALLVLVAETALSNRVSSRISGSRRRVSSAA